MTRVFPVDDPSRVGEIRRSALALAWQEGLNESLASNAALVATEISTNLVKYAQGGEVFLSPLSQRTGPGIEILAVDRGPGMAHVERCLSDGFSSLNTSGTGLGAVARLSQEFDVHSEPGKGTVLVARIRISSVPATSVGAVTRPITGEDACGDAWAFSAENGRLALIVADGLGHGITAARASNEAVAAFRHSVHLPPVDLLRQVHGSLRGTRGAAVSVVAVDQNASTVRYAGIGNVSGVLIGGAKPIMMVSHNGTAGHQSPRLQEFSYPLADQVLVILHSDGLHTNWKLDDHPGIRRRDPSVIAGVIYRGATRNRDDACVVVARIGATP